MNLEIARPNRERLGFDFEGARSRMVCSWLASSPSFLEQLFLLGKGTKLRRFEYYRHKYLDTNKWSSDLFFVVAGHNNVYLQMPNLHPDPKRERETGKKEERILHPRPFYLWPLIVLGTNGRPVTAWRDAVTLLVFMTNFKVSPQVVVHEIVQTCLICFAPNPSIFSLALTFNSSAFGRDLLSCPFGDYRINGTDCIRTQAFDVFCRCTRIIILITRPV